MNRFNVVFLSNFGLLGLVCLVFPTGQDSANFWEKGQNFLHCPGTKGQRDRLKILPTDGTNQDSMSKSKYGTVQDFDCLSRPVLRDKTGQSRKGRSITGKGCSKTKKKVLKQERMF
jgi:hypothetical protein